MSGGSSRRYPPELRERMGGAAETAPPSSRPVPGGRAAPAARPARRSRRRGGAGPVLFGHGGAGGMGGQGGTGGMGGAAETAPPSSRPVPGGRAAPAARPARRSRRRSSQAGSVWPPVSIGRCLVQTAVKAYAGGRPAKPSGPLEIRIQSPRSRGLQERARLFVQARPAASGRRSALGDAWCRQPSRPTQVAGRRSQLADRTRSSSTRCRGHLAGPARAWRSPHPRPRQPPRR